MSTVVDTSFDVDLSLLVGPLDEVTCEHSQHTKKLRAHDSGPATHYVRGKHECITHLFYAACSKFVGRIQSNSGTVWCATCSTRLFIAEALEVVGPVNE